MRKSDITKWLLALLLTVSATCVWAGRKNPLVWTPKQDHLGRYTGYYLYVAKGFNVTFGANYYYGDIDNTGIVFNGGFQTQNFRGGLALTYQHPVANHFNLRSSVAVGFLHGDNSAFAENDPKRFQSLYFEPSVCVDYYPVHWLGFYLFAGVGANLSLIDFEFANPGGEPVTGNAFRVLPMVPLGLGWAIPLGRSSGVMLHVEVSAHQGVVDSPTLNLDAYPQTKAQNGVRDYGLSKQAEGKRTNQWADGYFQAALTLSYRWL